MNKFNKQSITGSDGKLNELKDVLRGKRETEQGMSAGTEAEGLDDSQDVALHAKSEELKLVKAKLTQLEEEVALLKGEVKEKESDRLRTLAEFNNFQNRLKKEKEEFLKYANEKLINEFLPVFDSLEMTVEHTVAANHDDDSHRQAIVDGVGLVLKQFLATFDKCGVQCVEGEGLPFDPHSQEAIGQEETNAVKPDHVSKVNRKGFVLGGRVIRPALVTVAKAPAEKDAADPQADDNQTLH